MPMAPGAGASVAHGGALVLVLHGHLPFVRHPEHPRFLEEEWLFEAMAECYLPLLEVFEGLCRDGVEWRATLSLSPTLLSMLTDPLLQQRFLGYLEERLQALVGERARLGADPRFAPMVQFYAARYARLRERFLDDYGADLSGGFRRLAEAGHLELITCAATHGYLPLLAAHPESLRAQLAVAVQTHTRVLGRRPRGIWLPECGYFPGLDALLADFGLEFFFVETHGLLHGTPPARHGVRRPVRTPAGPAAFGRDPGASRQVWSAESGYPGHPLYRDFYRDAGFDSDAPHLARLRHAGQPGFTGLKYHRITGSTQTKKPYEPARAAAQAQADARHFAAQQLALLRAAGQADAAPVIVAPYDAELFGHWWFEGPLWLDALFRALPGTGLRAVIPSSYLALAGPLQCAVPAESSWGAGGFHEMWLNETNDWIYPWLHQAAERMIGLAERLAEAQGPRIRALNQAGRELLLAQASDWPFILKTGTSPGYARARFETHLARFHRCADMAESGPLDPAELEALAAYDNLFPDLDYRVFAARRPAVPARGPTQTQA